MKQKILILLLIALCFIAVMAIYAHAAEMGNPDYILEKMQTILKGKQDILLSYARSLFMGLATISLAMGIINNIYSGDSNLGTIAVILARWIINHVSPSTYFRYHNEVLGLIYTTNAIECFNC